MDHQGPTGCYRWGLVIAQATILYPYRFITPATAVLKIPVTSQLEVQLHLPDHPLEMQVPRHPGRRHRLGLRDRADPRVRRPGDHPGPVRTPDAGHRVVRPRVLHRGQRDRRVRHRLPRRVCLQVQLPGHPVVPGRSVVLAAVGQPVPLPVVLRDLMRRRRGTGPCRRPRSRARGTASCPAPASAARPRTRPAGAPVTTAPRCAGALRPYVDVDRAAAVVGAGRGVHAALVVRPLQDRELRAGTASPRPGPSPRCACSSRCPARKSLPQASFPPASPRGSAPRPRRRRAPPVRPARSSVNSSSNTSGIVIVPSPWRPRATPGRGTIQRRGSLGRCPGQVRTGRRFEECEVFRPDRVPGCVGNREVGYL